MSDKKSTKGSAKAEGKEKASSKQQARLSFLSRFGQKIKDAWDAMPADKRSSAAVWKVVFPHGEVVQRMTDYATMALGLRVSKDAGLVRWVDEDKPFLTSHTAATPHPKKNGVKKAKEEPQS